MTLTCLLSRAPIQFRNCIFSQKSAATFSVMPERHSSGSGITTWHNASNSTTHVSLDTFATVLTPGSKLWCRETKLFQKPKIQIIYNINQTSKLEKKKYALFILSEKCIKKNVHSTPTNQTLLILSLHKYPPSHVFPALFSLSSHNSSSFPNALTPFHKFYTPHHPTKLSLFFTNNLSFPCYHPYTKPPKSLNQLVTFLRECSIPKCDKESFFR